MESFIIGAAAALIGVLSGQGLVLNSTRRRSDARFQAIEGTVGAIERVVPELITRNEVQAAFQQVAQIEAQRIAQQQQAARASQVFGTPAAPPPSVSMNTSINSQLAALNERLAQLNAQIPEQ